MILGRYLAWYIKRSNGKSGLGRTILLVNMLCAMSPVRFFTPPLCLCTCPFGIIAAVVKELTRDPY